MFGLNAFGKVGAAIRSAFAALWSPASLFANSEVGAWYDPSDLTTMFQDRAGTAPVTADGQTVGKILDKSGRGNHAVAPSDAARPLYKTDGTYHWLQFDGVDDSLSTAAIDFTSTDKMSLFAGVKKTSGNGTQAVVELGTGVFENSFAITAPSFLNNDYDFRLCTNARAAAATYAPPITNVLAAQHDIAGATASAETNARINGAGVALTGVNTSSGNFINSSLYVGRRNNTSQPLNGNIYSLIVRGALSTTQEITDTETWVNSKTGAY